jgi:hypothetical protein
MASVKQRITGEVFISDELTIFGTIPKMLSWIPRHDVMKDRHKHWMTNNWIIE